MCIRFSVFKKKKEKTTSMKDRHPKEKKKYTEGEGQEESS